MKPFDLEAAKRGEPLKTRSGLEAYFVGMSQIPGNEQPVIIETEDGVASNYGLDGRYYFCGGDSDADIFMTEKPRVAYMTVLKAKGSAPVYLVYDSEAAALQAAEQYKGTRTNVLVAAKRIEY